MKKDYFFPSEDTVHKGTWLIWPHNYTYGINYRKELEPIWIEMVKALHVDEKVYIIAYNQKEQERIKELLNKEDVNLHQIEFTIAKSDDVWVRDTGPIFVHDKDGVPTIIDFSFDGWGKKVPYHKDDKIPQYVVKSKELPIVSVPKLVLEGGAVELDGAGTLLACKSSVKSKNRNQNITLKEVEDYARKYLGVTNFIWLEGVVDEDITDGHIDGMARFYNDKTILTVSENDFLDLYEGIREEDYDTLISAHNTKGDAYQIVELPMTAKNVKGLDYKGSYLNFYIANEVILLPVYGDENDKKAIEILSELYQDKELVAIDVTNLYQYGGMIHCITQQQPVSTK